MIDFDDPNTWRGGPLIELPFRLRVPRLAWSGADLRKFLAQLQIEGPYIHGEQGLEPFDAPIRVGARAVRGIWRRLPFTDARGVKCIATIRRPKSGYDFLLAIPPRHRGSWRGGIPYPGTGRSAAPWVLPMMRYLAPRLCAMRESVEAASLQDEGWGGSRLPSSLSGFVMPIEIAEALEWEHTGNANELVAVPFDRLRALDSA